MKTVKKVSKSFKNSQKVGHKKFVICLQKVLKTYFSCFANIVLGVCSIVCVLSLDPFFSCVFRLNVDDVNVIFLSIFFPLLRLQLEERDWLRVQTEFGCPRVWVQAGPETLRLSPLMELDPRKSSIFWRQVRPPP